MLLRVWGFSSLLPLLFFSSQLPVVFVQLPVKNVSRLVLTLQSIESNIYLMRAELVQNFTCEFLVYETCISHMTWKIYI